MKTTFDARIIVETETPSPHSGEYAQYISLAHFKSLIHSEKYKTEVIIGFDGEVVIIFSDRA